MLSLAGDLALLRMVSKDSASSKFIGNPQNEITKCSRGFLEMRRILRSWL